MVITFSVFLALMLILIRPLQRNPFFLIYFGLVIGAAYYMETYMFKLSLFSPKLIWVFVLLHIIIINLVTIIAYGTDKKAAIKVQWRVPEMQLHTLELLGGWVGAFIAQKIFHHKTKKKSYQSLFWLTLIIQLTAVYYIAKFLHIF